mmetsp:Transcript_9178/g.12508  ORF Transcript_9178/g.12508 Transcript_9178/m.12508 type:complete len:83 (-) Transcript_9178:945-1193(-)
MEAYLNLALFSLMNISEIDWELEALPAVRASNILSITIFSLTVIVPIGLLLYYCMNRHRWQDDSFQKRAGTFFEGMRVDENS